MAYSALNRASRLFFYAYVMTLVGAGAWGVVFARLDLRWLIGVHLGGLRPVVEANLGNQHRFLRAMELGFGVFAWLHRDDIFRVRHVNRLFLGVMGLGIAARLLGLGLDGVPSATMLVFLGFEAAAFTLIVAATCTTLEQA